LVGSLLEVVLSVTVIHASPRERVASGRLSLEVARRTPQLEGERAAGVPEVESLNEEVARHVWLVAHFGIGVWTIVDFDRATVVVLGHRGHKQEDKHDDCLLHFRESEKLGNSSEQT